MTDVSQATHEPAAPPPPSDAPDALTRHIDAPIKGASDDELVRESVKALNRQRESGGDDPFAEQRNLVDVELKYDGRDNRPKTLREATKDVSDRHLLERPEAQLARQQFGLSDDEILKLTKNEGWLKSLGYSDIEAASYARRGEPPAMKMIAARDDGSLIRPLDDSAPITEADAFRNRSELKRGVRNFRQAAAEAQAQLLEQLSAGQQEQATVSPASTANEMPSPAQTTPAVSQSQPGPDPVAVARAELQVERAIRASSFEEQRAAAEIEKWVQWGRQNFPELQSEQAVKEAPPARLEQLRQAAQKIAQGVNSWMAHGAKATEVRQTRENQLATHHNALLQHTYKEFSRQHDDAAAAKIPELKDSAKAHALRTATKQMLKDVGFSEDEVTAAWAGKTGVPLRDYRVQMLLADGARWRMAQAKANQVTKAPIPPVQRPGTIQVRGSGDMETVQRLTRELESATGDRAVRLATKLTRARRAAGM